MMRQMATLLGGQGRFFRRVNIWPETCCDTKEPAIGKSERRLLFLRETGEKETIMPPDLDLVPMRPEPDLVPMPPEPDLVPMCHQENGLSQSKSVLQLQILIPVEQS